MSLRQPKTVLWVSARVSARHKQLLQNCHTKEFSFIIMSIDENHTTVLNVNLRKIDIIMMFLGADVDDSVCRGEDFVTLL